MEYLDILDENGELTGQTVAYDVAHQKGILHKAVHVWLLNSKGELLIQKRSANKEAYPNQWEISASGHVSAGQTSLEAARRETKEELGLDLPDQAFQYLFTLKHS